MDEEQWDPFIIHHWVLPPFIAKGKVRVSLLHLNRTWRKILGLFVIPTPSLLQIASGAGLHRHLAFYTPLVHAFLE